MVEDSLILIVDNAIASKRSQSRIKAKENRTKTKTFRLEVLTLLPLFIYYQY
ncbi:MAG: hypothetical protein HSCHL_0543 [Hydrogenibacillus schlegelii]|uniref:Uncharacterized protein n=1 Tax=Hydrogenibacillus schlegelii TaxID=1484 RepID=A0A2T5GDK0_HYDSH|nr:MAG: hypothetical protein HSCHL_0543 [Hydrogenibacillus schlegelii]